MFVVDLVFHKTSKLTLMNRKLLNMPQKISLLKKTHDLRDEINDQVLVVVVF